MLYKFIVAKGAWQGIPGAPGLEAQGCLAVVRAANVDQARDTLLRWCEEEGINSTWVGIAKVVEYPDGGPKVIAYAEV